MSPSGHESQITINIGLDMQDLYDQTRALEQLFRDQIAALGPTEETEALGNELAVSVDASDVRTKAFIMAKAWGAAARSLERSGLVCKHPEPRRLKVDDSMDICLDCDRAIAKRRSNG